MYFTFLAYTTYSYTSTNYQDVYLVCADGHIYPHLPR